VTFTLRTLIVKTRGSRCSLPKPDSDVNATEICKKRRAKTRDDIYNGGLWFLDDHLIDCRVRRASSIRRPEYLIGSGLRQFGMREIRSERNG